MTKLTTYVPSSSPLVCIWLVWENGAARDPEGYDGACAFAATLARRSTKMLSRQKLDLELDKLGSSVHFSTTATHLHAKITCLEEALTRTWDLFLSMCQGEGITTDNWLKVAKERLAELEEASLDGDWLAARGVQLYAAPNHPYSRPVYGDVNSIDQMKEEVLHRVWKSAMSAPCTVGVTGNVSPLVIEKLCESIPSSREQAAPNVTADFSQQRLTLTIEQPVLHGVHLLLAHPGPATFETRVAYTVWEAAVGGLFTSRLNRDLRTNGGLTYGADYFSWAAPLQWWSMMRTACSGENLQLVLERLKMTFTEARDGLTLEEFDHARAHCLGNLEIAHATPIDRLSQTMEAFCQNTPTDYKSQSLDILSDLTNNKLTEIAQQICDDFSTIVVTPQSSDTTILAKELVLTSKHQ